jgi:hypothetical protein
MPYRDTGCTFLVKKVPGAYQVRIIRPNTQDSESHVVKRSPKHCGVVLKVPMRAGDWWENDLCHYF